MRPGKGSGGFSLIEATLYAALLSFVVGMVMTLFYRGFAVHRQAEACVSDVEAALRLDRDLREDLRLGKDASIGADGSLSIPLPGGREARYAPAKDGVERQETPGGGRRYCGMSGWSASREGRLMRVKWQALPHGKRGEGGTPPAFETAAPLGSETAGFP